MTISPATKQLLVVGVLGVILLIVVGIQKRNSNTSLLVPNMGTPPQSEQTLLADAATLYIQPTTSTPTTITYRLALDSKSQQVNAISIRFQLSGPANTSEISFVMDPTLQEAGWQVAINKTTTEAKNEKISFDLALINVQPNGGTVFTQDSAIGTFSAQPTTSFALDQELSMVTTEQGGQLDLQLLQSE
jgi:hypothetical protein